MKRTKRYYDIYDVSIFDLLRSGGQFPSGSDVNEELLAEEYQRGYREGENQLNVKLDEVINKAKAQGELYDPHTVKQFGNYVGERAYTEAEREGLKRLETYRKTYMDDIKLLKESKDSEFYDYADFEHEKQDEIKDAYEAKIKELNDMNQQKLEMTKTLNKAEIDFRKKIAELRGYTKASIPTIKINNIQQPIIHDSIDEEIDELLEKDELANEDYDYPEKTKELIRQINKERIDIKGLDEILKSQLIENDKYEKLVQKKIEQETRSKGKKDIQVNIANKNLRNFLRENPVIEAIQNDLNERRKRLIESETKLKEFRHAVKEKIDKHLKESRSPLDMLHEGVPLGKGRYHAPYAYAKDINPGVYNPDNLYNRVIEQANELYKKYAEIKRNYLNE